VHKIVVILVNLFGRKPKNFPLPRKKFRIFRNARKSVSFFIVLKQLITRRNSLQKISHFSRFVFTFTRGYCKCMLQIFHFLFANITDDDGMTYEHTSWTNKISMTNPSTPYLPKQVFIQPPLTSQTLPDCHQKKNKNTIKTTTKPHKHFKAMKAFHKTPH